MKAFMSTQKEIRLVNWIHFIQFFLTAGALGVGLYRMFNKNVPKDSSARWIVSVSAKSLVILSYEVLSTHVSGLKKFASLKAFMILNIVEHIFWGAAVGLTVMGLIQRSCQKGIGCWLTYGVIGLGVQLWMLSIPVAYISLRQWKEFKRTGIRPEDENDSLVPMQDSSSQANLVASETSYVRTSQEGKYTQERTQNPLHRSYGQDQHCNNQDPFYNENRAYSPRTQDRSSYRPDPHGRSYSENAGYPPNYNPASYNRKSPPDGGRAHPRD